MNLQDAIKLAVEAHDGQVDKVGLPYILHPWRVMEAVRPLGEDAMICAILHDVIEDTGIELLIGNHLYDFKNMQDCGELTEVQADALIALTRHTEMVGGEIKPEVYADYVKRCAMNGLARQIKLADLRDNTEPWRARGLSESAQKRYLRAMKILQEAQP